MYRSLLVPLDGSALAEQALPFALGIARRAGARVHVVTVVARSRIYPALSRQSASQLAGTWHTYLQGVVERARQASGVPVTFQVVEGAEIASALSAHARDVAADLVVMSTHGRGTLGRLWFGSVSYELPSCVAVPVLFVRPHDHAPGWGQGVELQHVLVTLDGSELAERVLEPAVTLGQVLGADYTLVRVISDIPLGTPELDSVSLSSPAEELLDEIQSVQARVRAEALEYLDGVAERLRARGLEVQTQVREASDPGAAILNAVAAPTIDLVALETHGHRGRSGRLLGGIARKVIHGTGKPVLVQSVADVAPDRPAFR